MNNMEFISRISSMAMADQLPLELANSATAMLSIDNINSLLKQAEQALDSHLDREINRSDEADILVLDSDGDMTPLISEGHRRLIQVLAMVAHQMLLSTDSQQLKVASAFLQRLGNWAGNSQFNPDYHETQRINDQQSQPLTPDMYYMMNLTQTWQGSILAGGLRAVLRHDHNRIDISLFSAEEHSRASISLELDKEYLKLLVWTNSSEDDPEHMINIGLEQR